MNDTIANPSGISTQVTDAWTTYFGMTGSVTNVDGGPGSPAYGNSHRLTTNICGAQAALLRHNCPMANGFQTVWDYVSYP